MRVLFWGTPEFALPALRALPEEGHTLAGIVTQPDRGTGRGRRVTPGAVKAAADADGVPILQPELPRGDDFVREVRRLDPEISVVVAYGHILRPEILELPPRGSINVHASLLPELRGAAPVQWAIARGFDTTGVTVMRMEAGLDSGPVLLQVPEPIRADETAGELAARLAELGAEALVTALAALTTGELVEREQDDSRATYAPKLQRQQTRIEWTRPAVEIARWVRATDPVPGAWTELDGRPTKLFRPRVEVRSGPPGEVLDADPEVGVLVAAGEDAVRFREVQPAGSRRMEAGEWIRGRGVAAGARFA
ncbi:MAG: methionyl-tRNA formyltransferase [Longimicrobiaceae bacterium]